MKNILSEKEFSFISDENKKFIVEFDKKILELGYGCDNSIGDGYCWGKYMIIYKKLGVKSKKIVARIYIREKSILLRLYFNNIDKHKEYIENSKDYIKEPFIGDNGKCNHCHNEKEKKCKFRKVYTIEDKYYEKCNGITFEFYEPTMEKLPDYINLLKEFYSIKKLKN